MAAKKSPYQDEIQRQLQMMKRQIDVELAEDIAKLRTELLEALRAEMREAVRTELARSTANIAADVAANVTAKVNAGVAAAVNNQLAVRTQDDARANRELVVATCKQLGNAVYTKVLDEVNTTLVPKIDNLATWMNYQTQDTTELITDYRRAVYDQTRTDQLLLTDGRKPNKPRIREGVDIFFGEEDP